MSLEKSQPQQRPRFGSDWDLDLGWILLWWGLFAAIVYIVYFLSQAGIKANLQNTTRDQYYADHCKIVFVAQGTGTAYQCQNK